MTPPAWLRTGVVPRFATGFAAMPLAVLAILEGGPVLAAVVAALLALAVLEFGLGLRLQRSDPVLWLAAAGAVAMSAVALTDSVPTAWPLSAAVLAIVAAPALGQLVRERGQPPDDAPDPGPFAALCRRAAVGLGALVYIGWLGSFIVLLRELPQGEEWLLLAVAAGMATDSGAFAVGKLLGRQPMAPRISPRKTIEGGIGGLHCRLRRRAADQPAARPAGRRLEDGVAGHRPAADGDGGRPGRIGHQARARREGLLAVAARARGRPGPARQPALRRPDRILLRAMDRSVTPPPADAERPRGRPHGRPIRVALLGSTGSIGRQTIDVIQAMPERFELRGLAAGRNLDALAAQAAALRPAAIWAAGGPGERLREIAAAAGATIATMDEMAADPLLDVLVVGTAGRAGLEPTLAALEHGRAVALANKEVVVMAGHLVRAAADRGGGQLRPVDSEHSAIWQCLWGEEGNAIRRILLTASGGALRDLPREALDDVTPEQALRHPTWNMGAKITIDSASLVNKGMETIEARWLFDVPYERVEVVQHAESIVHSLVEMGDGSVKAQLGNPDMRLPIQCALTYPERLQPTVAPLDLAALGALHFAAPDLDRYPVCASASQRPDAAAGRTPACWPPPTRWPCRPSWRVRSASPPSPT